MTVPEISVRNLQRKISVNVAELQKFSGDALKRCLRLQRGERTQLRKLNAVFVWIISDRRISRLHLQFFGDSSSTDVITFHDGEIFISVESVQMQKAVHDTQLDLDH